MKAKLIAFEQGVAEHFNNGRIRAPIHLSGGNEEQIIQYFGKYFRKGDYVFASWRSHYAALLAGVPPEDVMAAILAGRSIALCFPEYQFWASAIVGGQLPIALGVALGIKRRGGTEKVLAFCGDMCAETGIFHEVHRYAKGHDLPLHLIVEDNGLSVLTDTQAAWGPLGRATGTEARDVAAKGGLVTRYSYVLGENHSGTSKGRINF